MRIRKKPNSIKKLETNENIYILKPESIKGKWHEKFGNSNPINIELGMGRGTFIISHSLKNPQINYIGMDQISEVLRSALDKILNMEEAPKNLVITRLNIEHIENVFEKDEIGRIYLNFSDPWPKAKHVKRRLTNRSFLARYKNILKNQGQVIFKTDSRELFDYSLEEIKDSNLGFEIIDVTYDLTSLNDIENVQTEYEKRFVEQGKPIHRLKAILHK